MVLIDIGNTNYHIYKDGSITHTQKIYPFNDEIYYISVNEKKEKDLLSKNPNAVNLKNYVRFNTKYKGLGIDRIMACKSIKDGVVVDAGSAITVDVMKNGVHLGGFIAPGIYAFKRAFGTISEVLTLNPLEPEETLPLSTQEALNWGSLGAVKCLIQKVAENKKIYFTGGDGEFLSNMFENGIYVEDLVFRGMINTLKEMKK